MKSSYLIILFFTLLITGFSLVSPPDVITESDNVADLLYAAGESAPDHDIEYTDEDVKRGFELIHEGRTTKPNGGRSRKISNFYSCRSCHNIAREDVNLARINPEERLNYAIKNKLPYLQGSTFWGIVNRESWYNDDYIIKYGDLVKKAEKSLIESTQLCAEVCAQGRRLDDWEIKSILAYYWSLQIKVGDLGLSTSQLKELNQLKKENKNDSLVTFLKSKYLQKSPASFSEIPKDKAKGYAYEGRPLMGKAIYELSCQHCHKPYGVSDVVLDNAKHTFRWLKRNITDPTKRSIYHIIREGTYSALGHKEYMPLYTLEKLPHQQVEDLRAYIEQQAE